MVLQPITPVSISITVTTHQSFALLFQSFSLSLSLSLSLSRSCFVQVPHLWNRVHPTQSEVWAPAPSHRVCTNMHGAHFHRCHQRTSIWITRQPAIFEFRQNGINTQMKSPNNSHNNMKAPKQLGPGKGFIILYINVLINKTPNSTLSLTHTLLFSLSLIPQSCDTIETTGRLEGLCEKESCQQITFRLIKYSYCWPWLIQELL